MSRRPPAVAKARRYSVTDVAEARQITGGWLESIGLQNAISLGLPEVDDRYHIWRVPLLGSKERRRVGELVIDAKTSLIDKKESTDPSVLESRLLGKNEDPPARRQPRPGQNVISWVRNTVILDDSEKALADFPAMSVDLVFTSPPYYNARPEYGDYLTYEEYLLKLRRVVHHCHRVLAEGRFFVINVSPVLVRRASRSEASRRIAVPFDIHSILVQEEFDFIDDIVWVKPEGAGWATGRGRRFAADRNPLQYKPVPVTEYVLVYRKRTDKLIDWNIREHPDRDAVTASKIPDDYERTNVWRITPAHTGLHPAVFPFELAERVVRYYSFKGDVVLDPFAGIGTTGAAAAMLHRRFVLVEKESSYVAEIRKAVVKWIGKEADEVMFVNCPPAETGGLLPLIHTA